MKIGFEFKPEPFAFVAGFNNSIKDYIAKVFTSLSKELPEEVKDVFELEGARGGHEEWIPTSDIGRAYRKTFLGGNFPAFEFPTLTDTGELQESISSEIFEEENEFVLFIATDKKYGKKIEDGFSEVHPRSGQLINVPGREFLFFTDDDEELIDNTFNNLWVD